MVSLDSELLDMGKKASASLIASWTWLKSLDTLAKWLHQQGILSYNMSTVIYGYSMLMVVLSTFSLFWEQLNGSRGRFADEKSAWASNKV